MQLLTDASAGCIEDIALFAQVALWPETNFAVGVRARCHMKHKHTRRYFITNLIAKGSQLLRKPAKGRITAAAYRIRLRISTTLRIYTNNTMVKRCPQNWLLTGIIRVPTYCMVIRAHSCPEPKWHLHQFGHFCRDHGCDQQTGDRETYVHTGNVASWLAAFGAWMQLPYVGPVYY